ncbi:MAG: penicillin-binding transpeptidase domain-containing protein, partial [Firmicutes bacterium]|nr:penicillin-binding transpeptidase domain-containing protein [Bacillota bacterium]
MAKGMTIRMRKRALFTGIIVILILFVVLILRLIKLQIISGSNFLKMANEQQLRSTKLNAKRGTIYDRNMVPLAQSATVWNVVLEPNYIKNEKMRELICQGLHEILDIPKEKIYKLSQKKSFYIIVKKKIESDLKDRIINFKSKSNITNGIRLIEDYKRYYPFGRFASVILGFTGCDGQGLSGLENYYDKTLRGEQGKLVNAKNAIGTDMPFDYEQIISSKDGHSLILTIDATIQRILECNLRLGIKNNDVRNRAAAIAINPNTGEILGMAIEESFDPNDPFKVEKEEYLTLEERISKAYKNFENRAITNYYAGSVFKPMVAAWALDLNLIDKEWVFNCSGGIKISDRAPYIRCHKRTGHGTLNLDQGICKSCNPMFIKIGEKIGEKNFFEKFEFSGFHERTRIDLPGEANSIFFSKDGKMKPIDLAVASIGQNFAITPIQMIIGICAIANGGNLLRPYIVKEIIDFKGNIIKSFSKEIRRTIISEQTARRVAAMMAENVIDGGARNAYI